MPREAPLIRPARGGGRGGSRKYTIPQESNELYPRCCNLSINGRYLCSALSCHRKVTGMEILCGGETIAGFRRRDTRASRRSSRLRSARTPRRAAENFHPSDSMKVAFGVMTKRHDQYNTVVASMCSMWRLRGKASHARVCDYLQVTC